MSTIPVCVYLTVHVYAQVTLTVLFFVIPLMVVIISYTILAISAKISWEKMEKYRIQQTKKDLRLSKTLCIVIIFFIVAWLPYFIALILFAYTNKLAMTGNGAIYFAYFVKCLHYSNSAVNPFIYAFRQREFSNVFKSLFKRSQCHKTNRYSHPNLSTEV